MPSGNWFGATNACRKQIIAALDRESSVEQDDKRQLLSRKGISRSIVQRNEHQGARDRDENEESVLSDMTSAPRIAPKPNAEDHSGQSLDRLGDPYQFCSERKPSTKEILCKIPISDRAK